jgi:hypothetical protein
MLTLKTLFFTFRLKEKIHIRITDMNIILTYKSLYKEWISNLYREKDMMLKSFL